MKIQITHARFVLRDARYASSLLVDGMKPEQWRVTYYLITSLLRSVGYVLKNVDASSNALLRRIVELKHEELKQKKPDPAIFWSFIDSERHCLLKEYASSAQWSFKIQTPTARDDDGKLLIIGPTTQAWKYEIIRGYFVGRDQREVVQEAIEWWESYFDEIEREANQVP